MNTGATWHNFQPQAPPPPHKKINDNNNNNNNNKNTLKRLYFYISYIFYEKFFFLIFRDGTFLLQAKKFLIFFKYNFSYVLRWNSPTPSPKNKKNTLKKFLTFFKKNKKFLYFGMTADQAIKIKNFLYSKTTVD